MCTLLANCNSNYSTTGCLLLHHLRSQNKVAFVSGLREWRDLTQTFHLRGTLFPGQPPPPRAASPPEGPFKIKRTMLVNVPFSGDNELELESAFPLFKDFIHCLSLGDFPRLRNALSRVLQTSKLAMLTSGNGRGAHVF